MKGDFTRNTFQKQKHYSGVRQQQGRVSLDADWNEQSDIQAYHHQTLAADIIGRTGAPMHKAGFEVRSRGLQLFISAGRYYVDGIVCENEGNPVGAEIDITSQRDLPGLALPAAPGTYLAYLQVWERCITSVEDPDIREIALRGPDTAVRTKIVWQVKLEQANAANTCCSFTENWFPAGQKQTGKMSAQTKPPTGRADDCGLAAGGKYRGLENQLYRVEIHAPGASGAATFKWSRDNGSMVASVKEINKDTKVITAFDPGKDKVLGFAGARYIELSDEGKILRGEPGILLEVSLVEGNKITVVDTPPDAITAGATVWRWDGVETVKSSWQDIDSSGVQVKFTSAEEENNYRTGAYWQIPARTISRTAGGDIEWPFTEAQPPAGINYHYAPLALLKLEADGTWTLQSDCRKLFPPVTELTSLYYVSGDGQEARPGHDLPQQLVVGVSNGQNPVKGARVRFQIEAGLMTDSTISAAGQVSPPLLSLIVPTGIDGLAKCSWKLGSMPSGDRAHPPSQRVKATLLDFNDAPLHLPILFNAKHSVSYDVAYSMPGCETLPMQGEGNIPTMKHQLETKYPGLFNPDALGNSTVEEVLNALLCKMDAAKIPYDPTIKEGLWRDIKEVPEGGNLGNPPSPNTVQAALDELLENLESSDIRYRPECGDVADPTVRSALDIAAGQDHKISDILNKLLCRFNASHLPIKDNPEMCSLLKTESVKTVQDALEALCNVEHGKGGGCSVTVGETGQYPTLEKALIDLLKQKKVDICICMLPGRHIISWTAVLNQLISEAPTEHVSISGCGPGTLLELDLAVPLLRFKSWAFKNLTIKAGYIRFQECNNIVFESCNMSAVMGLQFLYVMRIVFRNNIIGASTTIQRCSEFLVESCHISRLQTVESDTLLHVKSLVASITLRNNSIAANLRLQKKTPGIIFKTVPQFADLFTITDEELFRQTAAKEAKKWSELDLSKRTELLKIPLAVLTDVGFKLPASERSDFNRLFNILSGNTASADGVTNAFVHIWSAVEPGLAIVIDAPFLNAAAATIADNTITGIVSIYGKPIERDVADVIKAIYSKHADNLKNQTLFSPLPGTTLRIQNNRLTRLVMGDQFHEGIGVKQDNYGVILEEVGSQKEKVIKAILELRRLGLDDAKAFVESVPPAKPVRVGLLQFAAQAIQQQLVDAGAIAKLDRALEFRDLYAECFIDKNYFIDPLSGIVANRTSLTSNMFGPAQKGTSLITVLADSAVFVGNAGVGGEASGGDAQLYEWSRTHADAANLEIKVNFVHP